MNVCRKKRLRKRNKILFCVLLSLLSRNTPFLYNDRDRFVVKTFLIRLKQFRTGSNALRIFVKTQSTVRGFSIVEN